MPLLFHNSYLTSTGAGGGQRIRITNLGHCNIKLVYMEDLNDRCLVMLDIIERNDIVTTTHYANIVPRVETLGAAYGINWEGEIELTKDQDLLVTFEDSPGVDPTIGDALQATVAYEAIKD